MSTTIERKVVEMKFDNKQFEKNTKETMSTLDKLKEKLNLSGASKGLDKVAEASSKTSDEMKKFEFSAYTAGFSFQDVWLKAASVFEYQVARRIVDAFTKVTKALTVDSIMSGFQEYETQIGAVQTILANTQSKGTTLQDVNSALDTLNTYADKTIYNFTEMTRNIGTFTAAGVDLKTSVSSIQGIANLAAVSGSTSQQASVAMYQLSQALSSGTVKLMDWNSVVNAGMGGQVFQDALKRTAKNMGTNVDALIKKNGSFRESLQEGWVTSKVLTETLKQFTMAAAEGSEEWNAYKKSLKEQGYTEKQAIEILNMANTATDAATKVKTFTQLWDTLKESAQSGWTQSWETIIGDFGEAKDFLTDVSDRLGGMIGASSDARNQLLTGGLATGWKQLMGAGIADEIGFKEILENTSKEAGKSISEIQKSLGKDATFEDALKSGFKSGALTADMFTESVHKMADKMGKMSAKQLEAAGYTVDHVTQIKNLSKGLQDGTVSMDEFVKKMSRSSGRENIIQALWNSFNAVMSIIEPIKEAFSEIFPALQSEQLYNFTVALKDFTAKLALSKEQAEWLKSTFKGVFAVLDIVFTVVKDLTVGIFSLFKNVTKLGNGILEVSGSWGDWLSGLRDSIKQGDIFGKTIRNITKFIQLLLDKLAPVGNFIKAKLMAPGWEGFLKILQGIWNVITLIGSKIAKVAGVIATSLSKAFRSGDMKAALDLVNGGILTAILLGIKRFVSDIKGSFGGITELLDGVQGCLESWQQNLQAKTLQRIAIAIGILAVSLTLIASIDPNKLTSSLQAITILFGDLIGTMLIFNKIGAFNFKGITKAIFTMIGISLSVLLLASALKKIGDLNWDQLKVGLSGVLGSITILLGALYAMSKIEGKTKGAGTMLVMAFSLIVLGGALKILATMDWNEISRALGVMLGALGILGITIAALTKINSKNTLKGSGQIISMSIGLFILGVSLKTLATLSWDDISRSLAVMAGALGVLGITIGALSKINSKNSLKGAGQMITMALSLVILGGALKILATMSWDDISRALGAMVGAVGMMALVVGVLSTLKGTVGATASILIMTVAINALVPALMLLGMMSWDMIKRGLGAIAGALLTLGVAAAILTYSGLIAGVLAIAGAIALLGAGCLAAGAGLVLIALGITALATAISAGATAIVAGLAIIVMGIITLLGDMIVGIFTAITNSVTVIGKAIKALILTVCDVLVSCVPTITETLFVLVVEILRQLVTYTPTILTHLFEFFTVLFEGLTKNADSYVKVFVDFLAAIIRATAKNIDKLISAVSELFIAVFEGVANSIGFVVKNTLGPILKIFGEIIVGIVEALAPYMPQITAMFTTMTRIITDAMVKIAEIIAPYIPNIERIVQAVSEAVQAICSAFTSLFEQLSPTIDSISGLVESLGKSIDTVFDGISDVIESIGDSLKSILEGIADVIRSIGDSALNAGTGFQNLANGVKTITKLNLSDMAASLAAVALGVGKIAKHSDGVAAVGNGMAQIIKALKSSSNGFDAISNNINAIVTALMSLGPVTNVAMTYVNNILASAITQISAKASKFVIAGRTLMLSLIDGINNMQNHVYSSANNIGTKAVSGINSPSLKSGFVSAGKELCQGLINGLRNINKVNAVYNAAYALGQIAVQGERDGQRSASPSKATEESGEWFGEGLVIGINNMANAVYKAGKNMGQRATDSISNALGYALQVLESDVDAQPTIRPVLDLSDVQSGAGYLNTLFNNPALGITSNIDAISLSMKARNQNGVNSDVVSAIDDLGKRIDNVGGTTNNYSFGNISYDDQTALSEAVKTIVRVATMERRV